MGSLLTQVASLSVSVKLVFAALGIFIIHAAFRILETALPRYFRQADSRYRVRKFVVFLGYSVGLLFLIMLFEDRAGRISFALGVAGAGVVAALQDVVASLGGWFAIGISRLYKVGARIQVPLRAPQMVVGEGADLWLHGTNLYARVHGGRAITKVLGHEIAPPILGFEELHASSCHDS